MAESARTPSQERARKVHEAIADDLLAALSIGAEDPRKAIMHALNLAALEERAACVLTCEELAEAAAKRCEGMEAEETFVRLISLPVEQCANAIRARGQ